MGNMGIGIIKTSEDERIVLRRQIDELTEALEILDGESHD